MSATIDDHDSTLNQKISIEINANQQNVYSDKYTTNISIGNERVSDLVIDNSSPHSQFQSVFTSGSLNQFESTYFTNVIHRFSTCIQVENYKNYMPYKAFFSAMTTSEHFNIKNFRFFTKAYSSIPATAAAAYNTDWPVYTTQNGSVINDYKAGNPNIFASGAFAMRTTEIYNNCRVSIGANSTEIADSNLDTRHKTIRLLDEYSKDPLFFEQNYEGQLLPTLFKYDYDNFYNVPDLTYRSWSIPFKIDPVTAAGTIAFEAIERKQQTGRDKIFSSMYPTIHETKAIGNDNLSKKSNLFSGDRSRWDLDKNGNKNTVFKKYASPNRYIDEHNILQLTEPTRNLYWCNIRGYWFPSNFEKCQELADQGWTVQELAFYCNGVLKLATKRYKAAAGEPDADTTYIDIVGICEPDDQSISFCIHTQNIEMPILHPLLDIKRVRSFANTSKISIVLQKNQSYRDLFESHFYLDEKMNLSLTTYDESIILNQSGNSVITPMIKPKISLKYDNTVYTSSETLTFIKRSANAVSDTKTVQFQVTELTQIPHLMRLYSSQGGVKISNLRCFLNNDFDVLSTLGEYSRFISVVDNLGSCYDFATNHNMQKVQSPLSDKIWKKGNFGTLYVFEMGKHLPLGSPYIASDLSGVSLKMRFTCDVTHYWEQYEPVNTEFMTNINLNMVSSAYLNIESSTSMISNFMYDYDILAKGYEHLKKILQKGLSVNTTEQLVTQRPTQADPSPQPVSQVAPAKTGSGFRRNFIF